MKKKLIAAGAGLAAIALVTTGCAGTKYGERYQDAKRGDSNTSPADTISFPDGFSNVATKCDHGNRVYVLFHEDSPYGGLAVVPNAADCRQ